MDNRPARRRFLPALETQRTLEAYERGDKKLSKSFSALQSATLGVKRHSSWPQRGYTVTWADSGCLRTRQQRKESAMQASLTWKCHFVSFVQCLLASSIANQHRLSCHGERGWQRGKGRKALAQNTSRRQVSPPRGAPGLLPPRPCSSCLFRSSFRSWPITTTM